MYIFVSFGFEGYMIIDLFRQSLFEVVAIALMQKQRVFLVSRCLPVFWGHSGDLFICRCNIPVSREAILFVLIFLCIYIFFPFLFQKIRSFPFGILFSQFSSTFARFKVH